MTAMTTTAPVATSDEQGLAARTGPLRRSALAAGVGGMAAGLLWGVLHPSTFFPAYLAVYVFFLGFGVGSLALLLVHHLTGGNWGFLIRRPLEAATMTLPLLALLFLPLLIGLKALYPWTHAEEVRRSAALLHKAGYLNVPFWLGRSAGYFAVWVGLALLFRRGSVRQDATEDPSPTRWSQTMSAPGLIAVFLSVTFASVDWMMSIEPEWYSSIYGVMVLVGMGLSALALAIVAASWLSAVRPLADLATPGRFNDLGNLLLAFTMLWAYMSFSQYLIIWSGNLAEEVPWYLRRSAGGWRAVCASLMAFHFFVPFFCLLIRETKRSSDRLWRVAVAILVMHLMNDVWLIVPAFGGSQGLKVLAAVPAALGVGGLWAWEYTRRLTSRTLVPRNNPQLAEALSHHGGGH